MEIKPSFPGINPTPSNYPIPLLTSPLKGEEYIFTLPFRGEEVAAATFSPSEQNTNFYFQDFNPAAFFPAIRP
jgi:hypothetical protein